jgi:hypothetical protein
MNTTAYVIVTVLVVTALYFGVRYLFRAYFRYQDSKIITCPETGEAAIVEVDAVHAALTSMVGQPDIRLQNCWRWPLRENCGQECLTQLDATPECLVQGVLMRWYGSKSCVYCGKPFPEIHWSSLHKPALQSPDGKLVEWREVPIEGIQTVMQTYLPVCWDCYISQSFSQEHPELVVYRPWRNEMQDNKGSRHA